MIGTAIDSAKLLIAGKLFRDNGKAMRQLALGSAVGAVVIIVLGLVLPLWLAAVLGGAASGLLQPYLFKDLKYA